MSGSESGRRAPQEPRRRYPPPEPQHGEDAFGGQFSDTSSAVSLLEPARRLQTTLGRNQHSNQRPSRMYHAPSPNSAHTSTGGRHEDHETDSPSDTDYPFQPANDLLSFVGGWMSDPAQGLPGHVVHTSAYPGNVRPPTSPPAYLDFDLDDISRSQVPRLSERTLAQPPNSSSTPPSPLHMYSGVARSPTPSQPYSNFIPTGTPNHRALNGTTGMPAPSLATAGMPPNQFSHAAAESRPTPASARVDMDALLYYQRRRRAAAAAAAAAARRQGRN